MFKRLALLLIVSLASAAAHARIHRIVVESKGALPAQQGAPDYVELKGVAYGDLSPTDAPNRILQDIDLAPKNRAGRVEYAATFTLQMPRDSAAASGFLLYEVVNRGSSIVPRDYTSGDIFLQSGWQGDIPFRGRAVSGGEAETIDVPVAKNLDGSSITGPAILRFMNVSQDTHTIPVRLAVGYASSGAPPLPVDLDTSHARMITRTFEGLNGALSPSREVPPSEWRWADCTDKPFPGAPSPTHICLNEGFNPALAYQLEYQAKDPRVLGIGLAAIRDLNAFLRHDPQDDAGWKNPLASVIKYNVVQGASQSGNTIRTFLNLGFNQDEASRAVFDGAMVMIAARQNPINFRFAVPGGASNLFEPGSDGVVWWADWPDPVRHHATAGLLTRCTLSQSCPKIIEVLGSSEFWSLRASPDFVGTSNDKDVPLPPNVRRYYIASTQHGGGPGGFDWQPKRFASKRTATPENPIATMGCVLPLNPNPQREIDNALLVALKAWVSKGAEPPPSSYPTLKGAELVPANHLAMHLPQIPGLPSPDGVANPLLVYDFGEDFNANDLSGVLRKEPPAIVNVVYPLVPRVDSDGNESAGIHTVLQQAPLGTYLGWNVTSEGFLKSEYCSLYGSYLPFAKTKEDRIAANDPRLSLEERYGSKQGYLCAVNHAAKQLVSQRLLLQRDADLLIGQATGIKDFPDELLATAQGREIAARLCR